MAFRASKFMFLTVTMMALLSCKREERRFDEVPTATNPGLVRTSDLQLGGGNSALPSGSSSSYDENAFAMNEGKRLFESFNCVGCHAHGGGGIGPALIDEDWLYGRDPSQIYNTIAEGRPNGMPSFAGKVTEQQIWQLVSYVRSMSGAVAKDAAPGRDDHMKMGTPESQTPPEPELKTNAASQ
jgi:cytochrome c oxidase cbb3-type subunit 3